MCASERGRETETGVEKGDFIKGMKDERFALRENLWTALKTYIFRTNPRKNLPSFSLRLGLFFFFFSPWIRNEHLRYTIMRGIALVLIPISNPSRVQDTERQKQQPSLTQIHTHTHWHTDVVFIVYAPVFAWLLLLPWLLPLVHRSIYSASMPSTAQHSSTQHGHSIAQARKQRAQCPIRGLYSRNY